MSVPTVNRAEVIAYRVAAHGLHRETTDPLGLAVLDLGIQYAAHLVPAAMAARLATPPAGGPWLPELAVVWSFRGAPHLLRRSELARLAGELWPLGESDAFSRLGGEGTALKKAGVSALAAFTDTAEAVRSVVTAPTPKGEVSAAVTRRLPDAYGYACRSCAVTHVYNTLFQIVGLAAGVELLTGSAAGRSTVLAPLPRRHRPPVASTGVQRLIGTYLALHGPATAAEVATFLGSTQAEVKRRWPDGLARVNVDGRVGYLPEERVARLRDAPEPPPVRLLPPLDPYLQARDRTLIVPVESHRKALWRVLGNPGAVLAGGEVIGTWRATVATRNRLRVRVEPFTTLAAATRRAVRAEAHALAAARGLSEAEVTGT